jgi:hypothetical protein
MKFTEMDIRILARGIHHMFIKGELTYEEFQEMTKKINSLPTEG